MNLIYKILFLFIFNIIIIKYLFILLYISIICFYIISNYGCIILAKDYGLFLADEDIKKGVWLEPGRNLEYYILRNGVSQFSFIVFNKNVH